jgi:uncharacterized membrane protein YhaH (DUF805 family)
MNPVPWLRYSYSNLLKTSGRARRTEFAWAFLANVTIFVIIGGIIQTALGRSDIAPLVAVADYVCFIFLMWSVTIRDCMIVGMEAWRSSR